MDFRIKVCPETSAYFPSLARPQSKILSATPSAQGSRYFVIEGQFLLQFHMSLDGGTNMSLYCHAWFAIYFSGSIEVWRCLVYNISILCLVMFGVVLAAHAFLFNKYLNWSMWVQAIIWYANSEFTSTIPFRVSYSILLLGLREGHSWPQLLEVRVSIDLVRVADAENTGLWKDVSVNHVFVAIFFGIKNWAQCFFFPKYWHSSMQSIFDSGDSDGTWSCCMFSGSFVRFTAYIWFTPNPTSVFGRSISHSSCKQNI